MDDDVQRVIASIENNTCDPRVDLSDRHLDDAAARRLANALGQNTSLRDLNVSGTYFTHEGIASLTQVLATNQSLRSLNLSVNVADHGGSLQLSEALLHNTTLEELHLNEAGVTTKGAMALASALRTNSSLRTLTLDRNNFGPGAVAEFMLLLTRNTTLRHLSLPVEPNTAAQIHAACDPERQIDINGTRRDTASDAASAHRSSLQESLPSPQGRPQRSTRSSSTTSAPPGGTPLARPTPHPGPSSPSSSSSSGVPTSAATPSTPFIPPDPSPSSYSSAARPSTSQILIRQVTCERDYLRRSLDAAKEELQSLRNETETKGLKIAAMHAEARQLRTQMGDLQNQSEDAAEQHEKDMAEVKKAYGAALEEARQLRAQVEDLQNRSEETAEKHAEALRVTKMQLTAANTEKKRLQQGAEDAHRNLRTEEQARTAAEQEVACLRKQLQRAPAELDDAETQTEATHVSELLTHHTEAALNLNIPPSRFCDLKRARNPWGKLIRANDVTLYTATLGGHRIALKQIEDVDVCPRLKDIVLASEAGDDEEKKRLLREALVLLSIRHPHIVSFLGLSHDRVNKTLSFVLSWAEGGSLYDHLHVRPRDRNQRRDLSTAQRECIAMEVAGAMQFLQAHGIVHRDLKSPNVLLDNSLSAKVTDFGLSAFRDPKQSHLSKVVGTTCWASPEQLDPKGKLHADTDVFSFGVLYWELCFRCKPWHHGEHAPYGASAGTIENKYKAGEYLPVNEEINGVVLSAAQQQLLDGCFDVSGNRLDFTQLHKALRELYNTAKREQKLDEQQKQEQKLDEQQKQEQARLQKRQLLGPDTAVWKFPISLLDTVKSVTKQLTSRPSVSIAPLNLQRDMNAVRRLLAEAGGPTADQPNPLTPCGGTLAAVAITHDKQKEAAFNGALACNKTRYRGHLTSGSSHPFSPKYKHSNSTKEPINEEQKQVLRRVTRGTAYKLLDSSLLQEDPPLRLQRVFHGVTSWDAVVGILGGDFVPLNKRGTWFGFGAYFTPDLDYALRYVQPVSGEPPTELKDLGLGLDPKRHYFVVLACDVQYGNPYPVLDAKEFEGKPLMPGHDAHVAVVNMPSVHKPRSVPFGSHTEWETSSEASRPVAEIVSSNPSSVVVRALLVFQSPTPPMRAQQCAQVID